MVRRLGRLFDSRTGFSIIVAMDHGIAGVPGGLHDLRRILQAVLRAGPDGVLLNAGLARRCADLLADRTSPSLVLGLDHVIHQAQRGQGAGVAHAPQISVEEAVRLGADCVKTMLLMGDPDRAATAKNLAYLAAAAEQCRVWEMPLMIEPYLWGEDVPANADARAELNADGARMAIEIGADILKLEYGGNPARFREIVRESPVPIVILGGPKRPTQRETFADVIAAAESGAVGLAIGRNIWQHEDPAKMTRALTVAMVRRDLDAALAELA
jgi:DhnA family fructose-bisphosphate aldolase class Ia